MKCEDRYMTARHAAEALGVSVATLYSYVSRGMLRSLSVEGKPRVRRYLKDDVVSLIERKEFRREPGKAAERGLHWGNPVLESALTLINEGRLFYRGKDALQLAQSSSVEDVAALLWTGDSTQASNLFNKKFPGLPPKIVALLKCAAHLGPVERCQLVLPIAAAVDLTAYDLRPAPSRSENRGADSPIALVCDRPSFATGSDRYCPKPSLDAESKVSRSRASSGIGPLRGSRA